ncbi:MAG TPA: gluconokinase [Thermoanaerobaculia bacterium]|nr:gluconokinase [Thermoanaerobaculia bacterium]
MGVAGTGKTTVGRRLAEQLGWPFLDADDLHSTSSRTKMAAGIPLSDEDRAPWLRRVRRRLDEHLGRGESVVVACSALRERYRQVLLEGLAPAHRVHVVHLCGDTTLIEQRLGARRDHFFDPALLASQLATLEAPDSALVVDVAPSVEVVVERILAARSFDPT